MASSPASYVRTVLRVGLWTIGIAWVAFYLAQNWRLAPNNTDDGLILDYIHQMSLGVLPHWDMIDAYGLFNWVFPVTFYKLAGQKVWGIRIWILLLKLISVLVAYRFAARASNRFYGLLGALGLMVLLGQAWQSLQTAYAFLTVVPLVLAAWHVLVSQPFRWPWLNPAVAAVFTTLAIWTKLNTGLHLFAGGLITLLCWVPNSAEIEDDSALSQRLAPWVKRIRIAVAVICGAMFFNFIRAYFNFLYFLYLLLPLLIGLGWTVYIAATEPVSSIRVRRHLIPCVIYFATTMGLSLIVLFGYYGLSGALQYAEELSGILRNIHYHSPFAPIGKALLYVGFNETFWTQVPWLLTLSFCVWLVLQRRWGEASFGADWPLKRAQASSIFLLATLHSFALYARSDETHIFQALLLVVPALFVVVSQVEALLKHCVPDIGAHFREVLGVVAAVYASTITVRPSLDVFKLTPGDYANERLEYIQYRPFFNFYVRNFSPQITDRDWDSLVDLAARYIDTITHENEPILVLSAERFLQYASKTTSVGGRYAFHFYLLSVRLLDRQHFDQIVPHQVIRDILMNPPRVMVTSGDKEPMVPDFPEFKALRDRYYRETKSFRHIHIFELKPGALEDIQRNPPPP